jgi:hypothetical protein
MFPFQLIEASSAHIRKGPKQSPHIIQQLAGCATSELYSISDLIEGIFDEEASETNQRFIVNAGIDEVHFPTKLITCLILLLSFF